MLASLRSLANQSAPAVLICFVIYSQFWTAVLIIMFFGSVSCDAPNRVLQWSALLRSSHIAKIVSAVLHHHGRVHAGIGRVAVDAVDDVTLVQSRLGVLSLPSLRTSKSRIT